MPDDHIRWVSRLESMCRRREMDDLPYEVEMWVGGLSESGLTLFRRFMRVRELPKVGASWAASRQLLVDWSRKSGVTEKCKQKSPYDYDMEKYEAPELMKSSLPI